MWFETHGLHGTNHWCTEEIVTVHEDANWLCGVTVHHRNGSTVNIRGTEAQEFMKRWKECK